MSNTHIVKRFDEELQTLQDKVMEMGGLVEDQIRLSVDALYQEGLDNARIAIDRDQQVNTLERQIDSLIAHLIAHRQPMAGDLRNIMALSKIVTDLERSGDEAQRIARMTLHMYEQGGTPPQTRLLRDVSHMSQLAGRMLRDSLDALARRDVQQALETNRGDQELDARFGDALRRLITFMMEDPRTISRALDVLWAIRALERIGDHARNMCEYVIYLVKGKDVRHTSFEEMEAAVMQTRSTGPTTPENPETP